MHSVSRGVGCDVQYSRLHLGRPRLSESSTARLCEACGRDADRGGEPSARLSSSTLCLALGVVNANAPIESLGSKLQRHEHVGVDGQCYFPFCSQWTPASSNLIGLVR
eukprot:COSAG05_NODE_1269_length_5318_cov_3.679824_5_plen_108_part_00